MSLITAIDLSTSTVAFSGGAVSVRDKELYSQRPVNMTAIKTDEKANGLEKRIQQQYRLFWSSGTAEEAMNALDKIYVLETELLSQPQYSYSDYAGISVPREYSVPPLCKEKADSLDVKCRKAADLPENARNSLSSCGLLGYVSSNIRNVLFSIVPENYNAFRSKGNKTRLATMDVLTGSVIVNGDPDKIDPLILAATVLHETFHVRTFGHYTTIVEMEEKAHLFELDFWRKMKARTDVTNEQTECIDKNISEIERIVRSKDYGQ